MRRESKRAIPSEGDLVITREVAPWCESSVKIPPGLSDYYFLFCCLGQRMVFAKNGRPAL